MIDTLFHIANDFFFFCIILSGIYLFIFALIALFRHSGKYPATEKKYRFALLVPLQTHIEDLKYPKELYTVITYNDPVLAVRELDENQYDIAVILGETTHVSPLLLQDINDAYDAGVMAMQLHHIIEHRLPERFAGKPFVKRSETQSTDKGMCRQAFLPHSKKQILP